MECDVHPREMEKSTIPSVLNECLRDLPHIGALRNEQKTCLVNLAREKMFLQSCRPVSVFRDNKLAITDQSQEEVSLGASPDSHILYYLRIFRKTSCSLKIIALRAILTDSQRSYPYLSNFSLSCNSFFEI